MLFISLWSLAEERRKGKIRKMVIDGGENNIDRGKKVGGREGREVNEMQNREERNEYKKKIEEKSRNTPQGKRKKSTRMRRWTRKEKRKVW